MSKWDTPPVQTAIGVGLGIISNTIYELAVPFADGHGVEHYHWGLISLILGTRTKKFRYYLYGAGGALIAGESAEDGPFGIYDKGAAMDLNLGLGAILVGVLLAAYATRKP